MMQRQDDLDRPVITIEVDDMDQGAEDDRRARRGRGRRADAVGEMGVAALLHGQRGQPDGAVADDVT